VNTNGNGRAPAIPILYLIDTLVTPLGGTERQLLTLLERLDRARFEPYLAFLRSNPELAAMAFPCPVSVLEYRSFKGWEVIRAGRRCVSLCHQKGIRVMHTFFRDATKLGAVWARTGGVPVVVGSRRSLGYVNRPGDSTVLRILAPLTTHIVANSEAAARTAIASEHLDPARVSVIANGLEPSLYSPIQEPRRRSIQERWGVPEGHLVVGAVANLRPIKNNRFLVDAAARLSSRFPDVSFVILGEGSERTELEVRIRERGLEGRFFLPGFSTRVPEDVQAFDIAVLCSDSESSPNSVIEYLASGKPTLATSVGGTPEIVISEDIGCLYAPGDAPRFDALLSALIEGHDLRSRLSRSARAYALERFSMERMVREHETLYTTLLARTGQTTQSQENIMV
jgi:glycosyltransferase involved in cell wall biosynthesis